MAKYVDYDGLDHFYDNIADRPVQAFDTVADMQAATYLEAGMTCHTNGNATVGDGGAAWYVIKVTGTADGDAIIACANNLKAHRVTDKPTPRVSISTEYNVSLGCMIKVYEVYGYSSFKCINKYSYTTIKNYVTDNKPVLFVNGAMYGPTVTDGVASEYPPTSVGYESWASVCINANGDISVIKDVNRTLTSQSLINDGYRQSFRVWYPLVLNGSDVNVLSEVPSSDKNYAYVLQTKQPTRLLCWNESDGSIAFISFAGRLQYNGGVLFSQARDYAKALGYENIVLMDGGGSLQCWTSRPPINHDPYSGQSTSSYEPYRALNLMLEVN